MNELYCNKRVSSYEGSHPKPKHLTYNVFEYVPSWSSRVTFLN